MDKIGDISIVPLADSQYVKPMRMLYTQNGIRKAWDLLKLHDSVSILIYNVSRKVFVFVKQFRPAVYLSGTAGTGVGLPVDTEKYPLEKGYTLELCAGIVDKNKSLEEIACEEVMEECGYKVPVSKIEKLITHRAGVGVSGDKQTVFYAEVTDDMKIGPGGGLAAEGEFIEVVEMTVEEVKKYLASGDIASPESFSFAIMWFLLTKSGSLLTETIGFPGFKLSGLCRAGRTGAADTQMT